MDVNITLFKNRSKKNGKIYYTIKLVQVVNGVLITTNGFIYEQNVNTLVSAGYKLIDMTQSTK